MTSGIHCATIMQAGGTPRASRSGSTGTGLRSCCARHRHATEAFQPFVDALDRPSSDPLRCPGTGALSYQLRTVHHLALLLREMLHNLATSRPTSWVSPGERLAQQFALSTAPVRRLILVATSTGRRRWAANRCRVKNLILRAGATLGGSAKTTRMRWPGPCARRGSAR